MEHNHHHHEHSHNLSHISKAFVVGIVLNSVFVLVEFATGIYTNSLALLSDAGHNLSDVATLVLALFAFKISKRKATERYTYGFHKSTILASFVNAVILFIAVGAIGWEAIQRFITPEQTEGNLISWVAAVGIVINAVSALFFFRDKEHDLNVKGAYLHLLVDALVSVGVVVAGIAIYYTHLTWIDPLISMLIMVVVVYSTWSLLRESLRLLLDAVPQAIDVEKIKTEALKMPGVKEIHHIHVWAMSTTKNALTAHLVLENNLSDKQIADIKHELKHKFEHLNIQHATLETEGVSCREKHCDDEL